MTLPLDLTGFDASNPIPGIYTEIRFAQGQSGGDIGPKKVLIMAPKTSAGSITADTQVVGPLNDEADAITYFGTGSPGHLMIKAFLELNKNSALYGIAPAVPAGTATIEVITFATTATGSGTAKSFICGKVIQSAYASGDTATVIAQAHKAAINADTTLPFLATGNAAVLTLTARVVGAENNSCRLRCFVTAGTGTTVSPTDDIAMGTSGVGTAALGTGTAVYTTALTTILANNYDRIIPHTQEAAPLAALVTQVSTQAEPSTGFRQKVIAASALTPANATTLATVINKPRLRLVNQEESPEPHYVLAAKMGAVFAKYETGDATHNFDGFGLGANDVFPVQRPYHDTAKPTVTELKSMLNQGVTPIGVAKNDAAYVVRAVTAYSLLGGLTADYRVRDSSIVCEADSFADDVNIAFATAPWTHVTDDPVNVSDQPIAKFATPRRVKTAIISVLRAHVTAGQLDPGQVATMIANLSVGRDPNVPSRINEIVPVYSAVLLHQHALLVKESSAAA